MRTPNRIALSLVFVGLGVLCTVLYSRRGCSKASSLHTALVSRLPTRLWMTESPRFPVAYRKLAANDVRGALRELERILEGRNVSSTGRLGALASKAFIVPHDRSRWRESVALFRQVAALPVDVSPGSEQYEDVRWTKALALAAAGFTAGELGDAHEARRDIRRVIKDYADARFEFSSGEPRGKLMWTVGMIVRAHLERLRRLSKCQVALRAETDLMRELMHAPGLSALSKAHAAYALASVSPSAGGLEQVDMRAEATNLIEAAFSETSDPPMEVFLNLVLMELSRDSKQREVMRKSLAKRFPDSLYFREPVAERTPKQ